jgi:hypothetical protein
VVVMKAVPKQALCRNDEVARDLRGSSA